LRVTEHVARVKGLWFRVKDVGLRVQGRRFIEVRVQGSGFRVYS
jgi:hypothetical protein